MTIVDARATAIRAAALRVATILALAWATAAQANLVRDDLGRDVRFDRPPLRVISLLPSITGRRRWELCRRPAALMTPRSNSS